MGLTLITGRANAGKTGVLHDVLITAASTSKPVMLLPQRPDAHRVSREFARRGVGGIAVTVFDDWLEQLWRLYGDGRGIVTPVLRELLLRDAVAATDLSELGESGSTHGFARILADLARRVAKPHAAAGDRLAVELEQVLSVYHGLLDAVGAIEAASAAALLAQAPPTPAGPLGANRFTDFSPAQEELLCACALETDVYVALTWQEGCAATAALDPLVERLGARARDHIIVSGSSWSEPALARLEERLFAEDTEAAPTACLTIGEAGGEEAECALVAAFARDALDAGMDPESIAITFRDVAGRAEPLTRALSGEGVAHALDVSVSFGRTSFGSAMISLLDACAGRGEVRERLLSFLYSGYAGVGADEVAETDRAWRRARRTDDRLVASAIAALPPAAGTLALVSRLITRRIDADVAREWKNVADAMLVCGKDSDESTWPGMWLDTGAHRAFVRTVGDVAASGGEAGELDLRRALDAVEVSMQSQETPGAVTVTEAHRMRGRRFDAVIVGGLNAAEFAPQTRASLTTALALRLGAPEPQDPVLAERLLFYTVVTRARRALWLVRQSVDENGEERQASPFWEEVLDVYRTPEECSRGVVPAGVPLHRMSSLEAERRSLLRRRGALQQGPPRPPAGPARGRLTDRALQEELIGRDEYSVTEIETYLSCPYRWFVERALRPRELDRSVDARERGSLAHEIVRAFYERWHQAGHGRVCADTLDEALELVEQVGQDCTSAGWRIEARGLAEHLAHAKVRSWARSIVADDVGYLPGFEPVCHELRFGSRFDVPLRLRGIALSGSVDRVEVSAHGLVIADYKSSSTLSGWKSWTAQGLVQPAVYAALAAQILKRPVLGGVYRSMRTLECRGFVVGDAVDLGARGSAVDRVDQEGVEAILNAAAEAVERAVDGMRSGVIEARPLRSGGCARCSARAVCGGAS